MEDPAPKRSRAETRWSSSKYCNVYVPSYIPPEFIIFDNGVPLDIFLLRCQIEDVRRMNDRGIPEPFFQRRHGPLHIEPRYDGNGRRLNTFQSLIAERKDKLTKDLLDRGKRFHQQSASGEKEIIKKIFFTPEHLESKSYGAILGSRGVTHQKLESETGCRIVLAGRGITDMKKAVNLRHYDASVEMAGEKPHCRITAPNEIALQKAVERIEWILSDVPDAIRFRDENRKRLAMDNGTFDPKTWVPTPIPGEAMSAVADDKEVLDFLAGIDNA